MINSSGTISSASAMLKKTSKETGRTIPGASMELSQIVFSVMRRYRELYPQEEIVFLSLPKDDPAERCRILEGTCRLAELEYDE